MNDNDFSKALEICRQESRRSQAMAQLEGALVGLVDLASVTRERQAALDAVKTQHAELSTAVERLRAERDTLEAQVQDLRNTHATTTERLAAEHREKRDTLQTEISALQEKHAAVKAEHDQFLTRVGLRG